MVWADGGSQLSCRLVPVTIGATNIAGHWLGCVLWNYDFWNNAPTV